MLANNPQFGEFQFFFYLHSFISAKLCFAENTIFKAAEHSFVYHTDSKNPFWGPFPKHPFSNQKCHFRFSPYVRRKPYFVAFGDLFGHQKKWHFPKPDSVNENALFSPSEKK